MKKRDREREKRKYFNINHTATAMRKEQINIFKKKFSNCLAEII